MRFASVAVAASLNLIIHASSVKGWNSWGSSESDHKPTRKPTKRPLSNTWSWGDTWGDSSGSGGNGPTNWVWNGWGWNEAADHDAWTGDGWSSNWSGKQTPVPTLKWTGSPVTTSPSDRKLTNTPSELPSMSVTPSTTPSASSEPSSHPSLTNSLAPSQSAKPSSGPSFLCLENQFCNGENACLDVPDLNLINQDGACNGFEACRNVVNTIANCASMVKKRAPLMRGSNDLRSQAIHVMDGNLAVDVQILLVKIYVTILLNAAWLETALVDAAKMLSLMSKGITK
eukprot:scaffold14274_cov215-Skeletonema_marinoi.AAC.22